MTHADAAMARRMLYASICAYHISGDEDGPDPIPGAERVLVSDAGYCYSVLSAAQTQVGFASAPDVYAPAFHADGVHDINACFVGITEDGYALIGLRGTLPPSLDGDDLLQWVNDWANDFHIRPVPWTPGGTPMGKAERGFAEASLQLWPWIRTQLAAVLPRAPAGVLITGHSKGGAMSYLIASLVQTEWPELAGKISVHAFAPAASVNADFVVAYDAMGLSAQTCRYIVACDIVPFLPDWREANIWTGLHFEGLMYEAEWLIIGNFVGRETEGGYSAPGQLVFFDTAFQQITGPDTRETALACVIDVLKDGRFDLIGAAHDVIGSYGRCFPPYAMPGMEQARIED